MIKYKLLIFICFLISLSAVKPKISDVNNVLVVIEEKENDDFILDKSPIADGIFNAMWDKERFIFFDMKIKSAIPVKGRNLDAGPYIKTAKLSGADSILLIKINYKTNEEKDGFRIKLDKIDYNLFSITYLNSVISGIKKIKINELINKDDKDKTLKNIGYKFLNELYD